MEEDSSSMRRSPRQARGRQRVAQILDAAEAIFGESGYEAATTNQIAARAGVPIGSLYQFFANKEEILGAVAARYQEAAAAALDAALLPEAAGLPPEDLAGLLLTAMVEFGTAHMGFTRIVLQAGANAHLTAAAAGIMGIASARLDTVLARRCPGLDPTLRPLGARVALTAVMALLGLVTAEKHRGHAHGEALIAETHRLLAAYVADLDRRAAAGMAGSDGTIERVSEH